MKKYGGIMYGLDSDVELVEKILADIPNFKCKAYKAVPDASVQTLIDKITIEFEGDVAEKVLVKALGRLISYAVLKDKYVFK